MSSEIKEVELVIGFDFGTSCSKVVIQDFVDRKAYAIPFKKHGSKENPYLLPTQLSRDPKNGFVLSQNNPDWIDLKRNLLNKTKEAEVHAIAYIALVLKEARHYFIKATQSIYGNKKLLWNFHLGIPSENYDDQELVGLFRKIAKIAWAVSEDSYVDRQLIRQKLEVSSQDYTPPEMHKDRFHVFPEVVAQAVGYARPAQREGGLYFLLDVGGGTLDFVGFNLMEMDGDDRYDLFRCKVRPMGTFEYVMAVLKLEPQNLKKWLMENGGVSSPIPSNLRLGGINHEKFVEKCSRFLLRNLNFVRNKVNPLARRWEKTLPVFICGGGQEVEAFSQAMERTSRELIKITTKFKGIEKRELPPPPEDILIAPELPEHQYHRISVAYGLSHSALDIGDIIPPSDISSFIYHPPQRRGHYVSKDEV